MNIDGNYRSEWSTTLVSSCTSLSQVRNQEYFILNKGFSCFKNLEVINVRATGLVAKLGKSLLNYSVDLHAIKYHLAAIRPGIQ